ncbi:short-chain dehydrogenase/reductase SDR [Halosimplex carlsbadense 2-9-1]|uniref:Short-chain dehydrogenase/reductase SDR n=1 Tax=Halosimplex carlsbadense 2-9-1 TaxID=797114 RepID=M0CWH5_9EURY|nr:SDR family oxidoreductase [Halosimplex carlsbadense]ELZ27535.1 short-chain dehydrogenase/reductase SDR [Halosimplex carlsbadense 2-9-1]
MEFDISGDTAIVTGAGRNIGQAIAELFAEQGANVVVADIDGDRARDIATAIREDGGEAIAVVVDVTEESDVVELIERTESEFGGVDILVNNAAVKETAPFLDLSVETFDRTLAVNLRGYFLCAREAAKSMRDSGGGRIVNLSSTSGHKGEPYSVAYGTSKAGILNFTRSAARALAEHDIRVNTLSPTRTGAGTLPDETVPTTDPERLDMLSDEEIRARTPLGRIGEPIDQARAVLYLASPASAFVSGVELRVNGARSA